VNREEVYQAIVNFLSGQRWSLVSNFNKLTRYLLTPGPNNFYDPFAVFLTVEL
jgi:hypothetical protein